MRFEFFIAARYLRAKRRQAVVGVITAISVIGVAAGVASLIIALAITNGMRRDLQDRLVGSTSHVDLMRIAADGIRDWRPLLEHLRKVPHVTAAAPGLYGQVLISRGARSGGALIKGVIPQDERTVGDLLQSVVKGSANELEPVQPTSAVAAIPPIVIGQDLAETIGAGVGDTRPGHKSAGRTNAAGTRPALPAVHRSGNLQVRLLSIRFQLRVHAAGRGTTAIQRAGPDLGDLIQSG